MKDLCWFPVKSQWAILYQKLHHFHHLLTTVTDRLAKKEWKFYQQLKHKQHKELWHLFNTDFPHPSSSVYLIVRLGVNGGAPLCALQGLLHLLHLDCQMGLEVPAQGHAGVLGRLPAGENLIITQPCSLVLRVQDLQCANLETVRSYHV